jgi:hypothetical protein
MRDSFYKISGNRMNITKNGGYKYEGNLFKNTLSKIIYRDPSKAMILDILDWLMSYVINHTKMIKRQINYTMPKDHTDFN